MSSVSSRRARLEVGKHIEDMMDRLCARHSVIDAGDWEAFPVEGLCWLRVKQLDQEDDKEDDAASQDEDEQQVMWPAWLLARGTETWSGATVDRDDFTRVVCCYGSGWTVEVQIFELSPFSALSSSSARGGRLYQSALAEAEGRASLGSRKEELANFESLISQNMDLCQSPVLLGRVWRAHVARSQRRPKPGEMIAVRWNDEDWWPATVDRVGAAVAGVKGEVAPDAVEIVYDDDASTRETIIRGSAVWNADVRCLGDDEQPIHDEDDVKFLDGTEFMLEEEEEERASAGDKQKIILIDALEEDDPEVFAHDDGDDFEPSAAVAAKDDAEEDDDEDDDGEEDEDAGDEEYDGRSLATANRPKKIRKLGPPSRIRKTPAVSSKNTTVAAKKVAAAVPKKTTKRVSHSQRRQLIKAAANRWSVSSRLVNGGGVALAASRRAPSSHNPEMDDFIVDDDDDAAEEEKNQAAEEKKKLPKKTSTMRTVRPPAATPSVLSLLLGGGAGAAQSDKSSSKTSPTAAEKKNDSEAAVDAVELALASSRKREARLLTMTTPSDLLPAAAPAPAAEVAPTKPPSPLPKEPPAQPPRPKLATAAADPAPPPLNEEPKRSSSSKLPAGWVAKWSERKQMYYYAHKAKRLTRWTPPRPGDEAASSSSTADVAFSSKQNFENSLTDEPIQTQAPGALDAARRTIAALEASMHGPPPPLATSAAPPPASQRYAPPPDQNRYGGLGTQGQAFVARDIGLSEYTPTGGVPEYASATGGLSAYVPTNSTPPMGGPGAPPPPRPWQPPGRPWQPPPGAYHHHRPPPPHHQYRYQQQQQYNNNPRQQH